MATPSITARPTKTIDGNVSNWNSAHLPIQYTILSDKFPTNNLDSAQTVSAVADSDGFAELTFGSPHGLSENDYIEFLDSSVYGSNVVAYVLTVESTTVIKTNISYISDDSFDINVYYKNYVVEVDIYAGIASGHALNADDPIARIATVQQIPNSDNEVLLDVSKYVKTKLSPIKDLKSFNDINAWKDFYIVVREKYITQKGGSETTSSDVNDSANVLHAVNGVLQFQNSRGGNMYEYVSRSFGGLFMTDFDQPTYIDGYTEVSIITDGASELTIQQKDASGTELQEDTISFTDNDRGVYRISLDGVTILADTKTLDVFL